MAFSVENIRKDFPIFQRKVRGKPLVYLDNAATSQRPQAVLDAIVRLYMEDYSNVHRGVHFLSTRCSELYEQSRERVAQFIGASSSDEVIYTRGTTESINLVARAWGEKYIEKGDIVLVTRGEHHSNFIPWQVVAEEKKATFRILELLEDGHVDEAQLEEVLKGGRVKLFSLPLVNHVLGTCYPVSRLAKKVKSKGGVVFVDGAQGTPSRKINVQDMGEIDFFAFSAHKMCGPTGLGVLWGKQSLLEAMDPYQYGGGMIEEVGDIKTTAGKLPFKFEAGTPHIAGAISFSKALDYLEEVGVENITSQGSRLIEACLLGLSSMKGVRIYGPLRTEDRSAVVSFSMQGVHHHDLGMYLDMEGIATRAGHHCAQPLMRSLGESGLLRVSFYFYNTLEEVEYFIEKLKAAQKKLKRK